jgi:hypothetical protein
VGACLASQPSAPARLRSLDLPAGWPWPVLGCCWAGVVGIRLWVLSAACEQAACIHTAAAVRCPCTTLGMAGGGAPARSAGVHATPWCAPPSTTGRAHALLRQFPVSNACVSAQSRRCRERPKYVRACWCAIPGCGGVWWVACVWNCCVPLCAKSTLPQLQHVDARPIAATHPPPAAHRLAASPAAVWVQLCGGGVCCAVGLGWRALHQGCFRSSRAFL